MAISARLDASEARQCPQGVHQLDKLGFKDKAYFKQIAQSVIRIWDATPKDGPDQIRTTFQEVFDAAKKKNKGCSYSGLLAIKEVLKSIGRLKDYKTAQIISDILARKVKESILPNGATKISFSEYVTVPVQHGKDANGAPLAIAKIPDNIVQAKKAQPEEPIAYNLLIGDEYYRFGETVPVSMNDQQMDFALIPVEGKVEESIGNKGKTKGGAGAA